MLRHEILARYCENNILDIPNALFSMRDVKPMLFDETSSIFFKALEKDLINVEFHTGAPCIVYIETGREVITTCHDETFEICPGELILLPKGLSLYSDYLHQGDGLHAYLLFFGDDVLSRFLSDESAQAMPLTNEQAILKMTVPPVVKDYFSSLHSAYNAFRNSPELLRLKLLEFLYLMDINDDGSLRRSLFATQDGRSKRNIKRLMEQFALSGLSAQELAELSGRSVSTFNREFKLLYGTTPKQWLIERRLAHAQALLADQQWSVTDAAVEAGYTNVSHFIAAFKKRYGKTPHQEKQGK